MSPVLKNSSDVCAATDSVVGVAVGRCPPSRLTRVLDFVDAGEEPPDPPNSQGVSGEWLIMEERLGRGKTFLKRWMVKAGLSGSMEGTRRR